MKPKLLPNLNIAEPGWPLPVNPPTSSRKALHPPAQSIPGSTRSDHPRFSASTWRGSGCYDSSRRCRRTCQDQSREPPRISSLRSCIKYRAALHILMGRHARKTSTMAFGWSPGAVAATLRKVRAARWPALPPVTSSSGTTYALIRAAVSSLIGKRWHPFPVTGIL